MDKVCFVSLFRQYNYSSRLSFKCNINTASTVLNEVLHQNDIVTL